MEEIQRIPAPSRREVMDWSLVLASQQIETVITNDEEGWGLMVAPEEYERAVAAIRQYRIENRRWGWHQRLPGSDLVFHWGGLVWCLVLVFFYYWSMVQLPAMRELGLMDNRAVAEGEWWRMFTAVLLHKDAAHLAANVSTGFVLLGLAMARYGAGLGLLAAYLAGAGGNLAGFFIYAEPHLSLGASGMVLGALGLLAVQSLFFTADHRSMRFLLLRAAGAGILILALLGFSPGTDVIAHVGGFVSGAVLGCALNLFHGRLSKASSANALALLLLAGFVMATWWMAMSESVNLEQRGRDSPPAPLIFNYVDLQK